MVKVEQDKYGRAIKGIVTLEISSYLETHDHRKEIPNDEAMELLRYSLEDLAGSNTGSELLANGKIVIKDNTEG